MYYIGMKILIRKQDNVSILTPYTVCGGRNIKNSKPLVKVDIQRYFTLIIFREIEFMSSCQPQY